MIAKKKVHNKVATVPQFELEDRPMNDSSMRQTILIAEDIDKGKLMREALDRY